MEIQSDQSTRSEAVTPTKLDESRECWLDNNRRAIGMGGIISTIPVALGLGLLLWRWPQWSPLLVLFRLVGGLMVALGVCSLFALRRAFRTPRVAGSGDSLWFDVRSGPPIEVPLEIVECFFRGQGPSHLGHGAIEDAETTNIVVRLAERAEQWQHVDVKPALAHWCDGYITLYGAWCQPIDQATLGSLNQRLVDAKRQLKATTTTADAS